MSCGKNLVSKVLSSCNTDLSGNSFNFDLQTSRRVYPMQNFEPDPFLRSRRSRNGQNRAKTQFFAKKYVFRGGRPSYPYPGLFTGPGPRPN